MQTTLRHWEYFNLTEKYSELYSKAKEGYRFYKLYDLITSRENIALAYRTIKTNKGSKTVGTDRINVDYLKSLTEDELVMLIRSKLSNYQPKKVRRVFIPKPNGDKRPLGIPSIIDRIIQLCFKQVLEPIAEAQFYQHSYGFRPLRSTHHAIARAQHLINSGGFHHVVDIDIKGFFDNINHTLLLKQLWNMGIRDRIVLRTISKMLKAEIQGEGIPTKGTPQGGILSPLLSNIVLHDLDMWVDSQWDSFKTNYPYIQNSHKLRALKRASNLKEGYIVRYADDFKIFCRDWKSANKWFHAVRLYLKDRLKLDISSEKSQIINLRKRKSEFLGFQIWAEKKKKYVAQTSLSNKKKHNIISEGKKRIKDIQKEPSTRTARLYNSWVLGLHQYFNKATYVNRSFGNINNKLAIFRFNRLKDVSTYGYPINAPPEFLGIYSTTYKTHKIGDTYLLPLSDVRHKTQMNFSQSYTPYTSEGRALIYKQLDINIQFEIAKLFKSKLPNRSIEYSDNRISRYSMKLGKCEITGWFLPAEFVHCHHYIPISLGGDDSFQNLRIIHKDIHILIHATNKNTIQKLIKELKLSYQQIKKINSYRKVCNLELVES